MNETIYASHAATPFQGLNRGWMLALGILMVVLGVIGLGMTYTLAVAVLFWSGVLAFVAGAGHLLDAFHHKKWRGVAWNVIAGAVYIFLGVMLTAMPVTSAFWLTKIIALGLVLTGITRLLMMFQLREQRARQVLLFVSAAVSVGLGIYIYQLVGSPDPQVFATPQAHAAWVRSWKWVIGLFIAIELIMGGLALIAISVSAKSVRET